MPAAAFRSGSDCFILPHRHEPGARDAEMDDRPPALSQPQAAEVSVAVPARLHLGFLDLHGGLGRRFGSLGITIDAFGTRAVARRSDRLRVSGADAERVRAWVETLSARHDRPAALELDIREATPAHAGLGSGTQLALAVGTCFARLHGLDLPARKLAPALGRGRRSGIGIGAFERGGVLLDGGRGESGEPPPIVSRLPFPDAWRILLIVDPARSGVHGAAERDAFRTLPPFPQDLASHLSRLMLMRALPALAEADLAAFATAVAELQRANGEYFAPIQGGRFASPAVAAALGWLEAQGIRGVGQSSWGPTGFAVVASEREAMDVRDVAERRFGSSLRFRICRGRNAGAEVVQGRSV
jgi:beta-ribofuranosylaminobenzene 5'-phosphate synthase